MGLLDTVIGGLLGGSNTGSNAGGMGGMGSVLSGLLGGGQAGAGQGLGGLLGGQGVTGQGMGGQGMGGQGMGGGIGGLLSQFESAGLGHIAQSWIGNGANQQVSPQQLQNVFGQDQVQGMASQAGMEPGDFLSQLSQHLPNAVHGMTPNGQIPDDGSVNV